MSLTEINPTHLAVIEDSGSGLGMQPTSALGTGAAETRASIVVRRTIWNRMLVVSGLISLEKVDIILYIDS